jgi:hypothetical protein
MDSLLRMTWHFAYTAGSYDSASNLFLQAPRPIHSLHVRIQPRPHLPWLAVDLRNLLDARSHRQYRNPLEPDDDDQMRVAIEDFRGNPLPGRSVTLTMGWSPVAATPRLRRAAPDRFPSEARGTRL